jgi:hypothetical protein
VDKQERDRLRELCNAVTAGRQRNEPYEAVDEFKREIDSNHVVALLDHIDALEGQVESGFREGYQYGWSDGISDAGYSAKGRGEDASWGDSDTKAALTKAEETGK